MKKVQWYLRLLRMLPVATYRCIQKEHPVGRMVLRLGLVLVVVLAGVLWFHRPSTAVQPEEPEAAAVSAAEPSPAEPSPPVSPTPTATSVTLTFAGDCTLGMDSSFAYRTSFNAYYEQQGAAYFLQNVQDIFAQDDLTVVNLEGPLTTAQERANKTWAFKGDPEYVSVLTQGSVEAVNLANNHSSDYGTQSLLDTEETLEAADIAYFGGTELKVLTVKGVQVGLMGMYTVYESDDYLGQLQQGIASLQAQGAQIIVCSFHWGLENSDTPEADQEDLAHAAIDAGASLVIGHHPHVLQGVEQYKGRYIVYSLGNFCFGGNSDPPDYDCMIFQQTFTVQDGTLQEEAPMQVIPCSISSRTDCNNYQPTPATGTEKTRILEKLRSISQGLGEYNVFSEETAP